MKSANATFRPLIGNCASAGRYYGVRTDVVKVLVRRGGSGRRPNLYHGETGRVEFVAVAEGETAWYVEQFGVGCMLAVPSFGLVYVRPDEHLEFIDRGGGH